MDAALLGSGELRSMMATSGRSEGLRERSPIAIYPPTDLIYGVNRMAQAFAGDAAQDRLAVFRTKDAARNWLLDGQPARPSG